MATLTYALFDALKRMYPPWKVLSTVAKDNPAFAMADKSTDGGGEYYVFGVEYSLPNRAATFSVAQTDASYTRHAKFLLTFGDDFGVVRVRQKVIEGARNGGPSGERALVDIMESQTNGILNQIKNNLGRCMFGDGSGAIGYVSSPGASTTLTLTNANDIVNFHRGQILVFAANAASALRDSGNSLTVNAINELAGTMTMSANVNSIAGIANSDMIFNHGDYVSASDRLLMRGLAAWNPRTAPTAGDSFFSFDRSVDVTGLSGYRFDDTSTYAGYSAEEAIRLVATYVGRGGGVVNTAFVDHMRLDDMIRSIGSKEQFVKNVPIKSGDGKVIAEVGFEGVKIRTPAGVVEVYADRSCPHAYCYVGDINMLKVVSIGEAPHWISDPSNQNKARTMDTDAAVEVRLTAWPQMGIRRPRSWGHFYWS